MNKEDPRVIKTKSQFKDAFKELVTKYDSYTEITIKELCDKANLNRRTFYLHYKQIDDMLLEMQEEAAADFYNLIKGIDIFEDVRGVVRAFFELNETNLAYQKMTSADAYLYAKEISRRKALNLLKEKNVLDPALHLDSMMQTFVFRHYHMSMSSMYTTWIKTNRSIPKEEMIDIVTNLVKNGIYYYKNQEDNKK